MPRRLRIHVPGGLYHVTLRGNHQQAIFREPSDRALLNAIVGRALKSHGARLHAYCWMTNHLHLFIQVGEIPLGVVMRVIASNYARAFQAKLDTAGHLFERRHHAKIVDVESYLFALVRYIHLNPVVDGLARSPGEYRWSSHRAYAGMEAPPEWLETDFVLSVFAQGRKQAQQAYCRFIETAAPDGEPDATLAGIDDILGSDEFSARIMNVPPKPPIKGKTVQHLIADSCQLFEVEAELLHSQSRDPRVVLARGWIAEQAVRQGTATLSEVARVLGRDRATLRYAMRQHAKSVK